MIIIKEQCEIKHINIPQWFINLENEIKNNNLNYEYKISKLIFHNNNNDINNEEEDNMIIIIIIN